MSSHDGDRIPFNKPFIAGKELYYVAQAVTLGNIAGDGHFTKACSQLLENRFGIRKMLLTPLCTETYRHGPRALCRLQSCESSTRRIGPSES